jgi:hypothetical protein
VNAIVRPSFVLFALLLSACGTTAGDSWQRVPPYRDTSVVAAGAPARSPEQSPSVLGARERARVTRERPLVTSSRSGH